MRRLAVLVVLALALVGCGSDAEEASTADSGSSTNEYPQEVEDNFTDACVRNAEASSNGALEGDEAQDYCECLLGEIQERMSAEEFEQAEKRMLAGEATGLDLEALAKGCLEG